MTLGGELIVNRMGFGAVLSAVPTNGKCFPFHGHCPPKTTNSQYLAIRSRDP